jgi:outer membrane protein
MFPRGTVMKPFRFYSMIAAAVLATAASAQQSAPGGTRFGIVSTDRVMRESRASQQVQKSLEAEFQKRDREIAAGPKDQIEKRRNALVEDINQRRDAELKRFIDKTNGIIKRIAEREKLDIVFLEAAYASARVDITDKVIKEIDAGR